MCINVLEQTESQSSTMDASFPIFFVFGGFSKAHNQQLKVAIFFTNIHYTPSTILTISNIKKPECVSFILSFFLSFIPLKFSSKQLLL